MFSKVQAAVMDSSNLSEQPTIKSQRFKLFVKKFYVLITVLIAVVVIVGALLIPQGAASIPLNVNYNVGEKMVYNTTNSISYLVANSTLPSGNDGLTTNNVTITGQETMEVLSFDGEFYTINNTLTMTIQSRPLSFSMLEKMNNTGYSAFLFTLGNTSEEIPNGPLDNPQFAQLLNRPVVKVGDSVTCQYPVLGNVSSNLQTTGDVTLTFKGIQDLSVPTGTYKVFRIDLTGNSKSTIKLSLPLNGNFLTPTEPTTITTNSSINEQLYFEYGTMRQIESSNQMTSISESAALNYTMRTTSNSILNQDINP